MSGNWNMAKHKSPEICSRGFFNDLQNGLSYFAMVVLSIYFRISRTLFVRFARREKNRYESENRCKDDNFFHDFFMFKDQI